MERTDSTAAMASLANVYGEESDNEEIATSAVDYISDEESMLKMHETVSTHNSPGSRSEASDDAHLARKPRATKLVSYGADDVDDERSSGRSDDEDDDDDPTILGRYDVTLVDSVINNTSLSQIVRNTPLDEVTLPPEPPGRCSKHLQEKITKLYEKVKGGLDVTESILNRRDFRNPSIYEKLIQYCNIDETGTNYPPDIFDPHSWSKESFYDALAEVQKAEMDRREKDRKERTKIEFITGVKKSSTTNLQPDHSASKNTKWESTSNVQPSRPAVITTTSKNPPTISLTTSVTGTKTTLISAIGNIMKK